jgi:hypothetical protein
MSPDRDPTPGELRVMLEHITRVLETMQAQMATREFVNLKFDSYNERITRLERDLKDSDIDNAKSVTELKKDVASQIRESDIERQSMSADIHSRIDDIIEDQKTQRRTLDGQRHSKNQAIGIAVLGAVLSIIVGIVTNIFV